MDEGFVFLTKWGGTGAQSAVYHSEDSGWFTKDIQLHANACLDCGFVGLEIDRKKLAKKVKKK
jgi:hypothetical protein